MNDRNETRDYVKKDKKRPQLVIDLFVVAFDRK
jgi:hypothetical protein